MILQIIRINELDNAFDLLYQHNREIGRVISEDDLVKGINKFLHLGDVIGVVENNRVLAMLNLYCNNFKTKEAYIGNVFVLPDYRRRGISHEMLLTAINICRSRHFSTIKLHVSPDNYRAIKLYTNFGFQFSGKVKQIDGIYDKEMILGL
ncbi:acetyltransferase [Sphaerochaeta pleomorpha str. Grapes]|uniref:Acetyltransferase n=1 Tax=Sphaerochaeta pleomorpha (strain ATCC BAA-1885 / DSM 22778 / Grapes) TaxID=158190 RepID=G8QWW1_SPHPG|nr:GNAT family N-acetyltransferase [Sphaerochaeta pleomorpha]AEV29465.1 acetyltransferase [Sphaerochaeta pleomorpha str. Grapes]